MVRLIAHQTNIDFPFHIAPFRRCSKLANELIKSGGEGWGKLEPCQEIERFLRAKIPAMMQTARDGGQVFQPRLDVP